MAKLLDVNGKPVSQENQPPPPNSPDYEVLRVLRVVETARRLSLPDLCAQLEQCADAGWTLQIDEKLPPEKAEIVIQHRIGRTVENKLQHQAARCILLGLGYHEALKLLIEEQQKNLPAPPANIPPG